MQKDKLMIIKNKHTHNVKCKYFEKITKKMRKEKSMDYKFQR